MFFGILKDKCPVCDMPVDGEKAVMADGKKFCSQEHAEAHHQAAVRQELERAGNKNTHKGGCCH